MITSGLVSISFRNIPAAELIDLAAACGLRHIEWGGDVHVPHGDLKTAAAVRERMDAKNLSCAAYGSYYRAGAPDQPDFEGIARTAVILGAPTIRVWAGNVGSDVCSPAQWETVAADLRRISAIAVSHGLSVSTEYHRGTITDTNDSAVRMLNEITVPGFHTYWQPPVDTSVEYRLAGLNAVLPRLTNVHVFQWRQDPDVLVRLPLKDGADEWRRYFEAIRRSGRDHAAMLEFIKDDSLEQLKEDAACLNEWLRG
jgi:sugar phosphate isomerase/epimerase